MGSRPVGSPLALRALSTVGSVRRGPRNPRMGTKAPAFALPPDSGTRRGLPAGRAVLPTPVLVPPWDLARGLAASGHPPWHHPAAGLRRVI